MESSRAPKRLQESFGRAENVGVVIVVPEVSRGAFRVPLGTDPQKADKLVTVNRKQRAKLLEAARRRRRSPA